MNRLTAASALALVIAAGPALGDVSSDTLKSISIPDKVETSIGVLEFFYGVPTDATIGALYDNLDRMRGVEAYLDNVAGVSIQAVLDGLGRSGADAPNKVALFRALMDSQTLVVTANTSTLYVYAGTDLAKDGPMVIEIPPGMLGFLDDAWQRYVGDMGVTGPDKGKGGKYLVPPPGYTGEAPDGYFMLKPLTNRNFLFLRGSIAKGLEPAVENIRSGIKFYPLKDADKPAPTEFVNMSGRAFNTVFPNDLEYFEILDAMIQREPMDMIGSEVRGTLASIGIVKGQKFAPDDRMKKLLTEAATMGQATARAITYQPRIAGVRIYPDSESVWSMAYANKNTSFEADGAMGLDARVLFAFNAGGPGDGDHPCGCGI